MIIPRRIPYFAPNTAYLLLKLIVTGGIKYEKDKLLTDLENILNIKNPILVSSGRVGLFLILKSSGLPKRSEIIIPGFTFGLLKNFIEKAGFTAIPVDINPNTFQMSLSSVKNAISKKTGAILATHIFGEPCEIQTISNIAKKNKLLLIEDCAESFGAKSNGKFTGTFGDVSIASFNIAKPIQGITGGLVFGKNKVIIDRINKIYNKNTPKKNLFLKDIIRGLMGYFISQTFIWPVLMYIFSYNISRNLFVNAYRAAENTDVSFLDFPPILAALTRLSLNSFESRFSKRRQIRDKYKKLLTYNLSFQKNMKGDVGSVYMVAAKTNLDVFKLRRFLSVRGIDIAIKNEIADDILQTPGSNVYKIAKNLISLPIYESLTDRQIAYICRTIKKYPDF